MTYGTPRIMDLGDLVDLTACQDNQPILDSCAQAGQEAGEGNTSAP